MGAGPLKGNSLCKIPHLSKTEMRNYGSEGADWKCVDRERSLVTMDHISKMLREMRVDSKYRQRLILMKRFPITITVASAAVCLTGCLHYPLQQPLRKPVPVPESFRDEFGGSSNGPAMVSEKSRTSRGPARWYQHYEVTVTNSQDAAARPVEFDYFLPNTPRNTNTPKGGHRAALGKLDRGFRKCEPLFAVHPLGCPFLRADNRNAPAVLGGLENVLQPNAASNAVTLPAILILPIMGGTNYDLEAYFARSYAKRGFAAVILHRPDIKKEIHELEDIDVLLRRSVRDAQRTVDWLQGQPEIDPRRLGLFGISMGAIRGTMVLALDARVRAGVLGLVGGDVPYILAHTREKSLARERNKVLERLHLSPDELEQRLRRLITCEPLTVAPAVDPSRVLMVIAAFDHVIPAQQGWELRRKLGNPEAVRLFSGHYSSVIYAPWLKWRTARFFEKKLGKPQRPQPTIRMAFG
jgi:hypothetical protein